jgi:hypothetical protein
LLSLIRIDANSPVQGEIAMASPVLSNWRLIAGNGDDVLGVLVGEVSGHPSLSDGWIVTSPVAEIAGDRSWAQTTNRRYQLATPLPDDQPLPPAATDVMLNSLYRNANTLPSKKTPTVLSKEK